MRLNDAHIESMVDAEGNELKLVRKFGEVVKHSKLVADVYMNDHKAFSAPVCITENTGYLMASVDGRFAFDPAVIVERILIRVHHIGRDEVLFSSNTVGVNQPLSAGDYDADIYFRLMNIWEGNTTRTPAPETKLRSLNTNKFETVNLDEQPSAYDDVEPDDSGSGGGSGSEGGSDSGGGSSSGDSGSDSGSGSGSGSSSDEEHQPGVPFEVPCTLVTAENFNTMRQESPLKEYYTNWPEFGEIESAWEADWDHKAWPWVVINYEFDQPYIVEIKYKEESDEDFRTVYSSVTDMGGPVPTTAGSQSGVQVPRTYFLVNVPYDMNMPEHGYNPDGTEKADGIPTGEFKAFFIIPED